MRMQARELTEVDTQSPMPRLPLKAEVYRSGFRTIRELAERLGVHRTVVSRVLGGHMHPSPSLQRALARELGLSLRELRELL